MSGVQLVVVLPEGSPPPPPPPPTQNLTLTAPPDITVESDAAISTVATGTATVTGACDNMPNITYSDVKITSSCLCNYTIIRIWVATDSCGRVSTSNQTIFVGSAVPPIVPPPAVLCPATRRYRPLFWAYRW